MKYMLWSCDFYFKEKYCKNVSSQSTPIVVIFLRSIVGLQPKTYFLAFCVIKRVQSEANLAKG